MSAELLNWIIRDIDTRLINLWPLFAPMRYLHNQCNILWNLPSRLHAIWKGSHMFWNHQLALSLSIWGQLFLFISTLRWLFPQIYQFSPGPVIFPLFPRSRCLVHAALSMDYWLVADQGLPRQLLGLPRSSKGLPRSTSLLPGPLGSCQVLLGPPWSL